MRVVDRTGQDRAGQDKTGQDRIKEQERIDRNLQGGRDDGR